MLGSFGSGVIEAALMGGDGRGCDTAGSWEGEGPD